MLHLNTSVQVVDNSGASLVKTICLLRGSKNNRASVGNYLIASVKKTLFVRLKKTSTKKSISRGDICKVLVVCINNNISRFKSVYLKSDKNSVVLVGDNFLPLASRVVGPVFLELRAAKQVRILSLSEHVV